MVYFNPTYQLSSSSNSFAVSSSFSSSNSFAVSSSFSSSNSLASSFSLAGRTPSSTYISNNIPEAILNNEELNSYIKKCFPSNYNFEIHKCIWRIQNTNSRHIALQMPDGLLIWANEISYILQAFCSCVKMVTVMGDVTYGACCIEDVSALAIGCDFLIHYGHSCLIPMTHLLPNIHYLYVFVEIYFDAQHLVDTIKINFKPECKIAILSTIQFTSTVHTAKQMLINDNYFINTPFVPQELPLSSAEVLGCTSPVLTLNDRNIDINKEENTSTSCKHNAEQITKGQKDGEEANEKITSFEANKVEDSHKDKDSYTSKIKENTLNSEKNVIENYADRNNSEKAHLERREEKNRAKIDFAIFVADGRFHLESALIQNPHIPFFKYDPFNKILTREKYDHKMLHKNRKFAIEKARNAKIICLILGTLGRQGSVGILEKLKEVIARNGRHFITLLLSEILPHKLRGIHDVDAFVQVACPRLSIDWGHFYTKPLLTPYEAFVAFDDTPYFSVYPMDYYSRYGGPWSNYNTGAHRSGSIAPNEEDLRAMIKKKLQLKAKKKHLAINYDFPGDKNSFG